jgi:hypothetical protein
MSEMDSILSQVHPTYTQPIYPVDPRIHERSV